jgi:salicylate hydroxylase
MALRVLIAGGGLGGLLLAHGLRKNGVDALVFGRDDGFGTGSPRLPLDIDHLGQAALAAGLPSELYDACQATRNRLHPTEPAMFDHRLREQSSWLDVFLDSGPFRPRLVADRDVLQEILQVGLGDRFQPDRTVLRFVESPDNVRVELTDGTIAVGDVLVVADGWASPAGRQLTPHREQLPTSLVAIRGERPLEDSMLAELPPVTCRDPRPVFGPPGCVLIMQAFAAAQAPDALEFRLAPRTRLSPAPDYLSWALVLPTERFPGSPARAARAQLHGATLELTSGWHDALRTLLADPVIATADAVTAPGPELPRPLDRVTALTDAMHALTPTGRHMAGPVLQDAAMLTTLLVAADAGREELSSALWLYTRQLRNRDRQALTGGYLQLEQLLFNAPYGCGS